jgi:hypothetical protein
MTAPIQNTDASRKTHVMFVENDPEYKEPKFYESLKEASDEAAEIIKKNPKATCGIYQLRADLKGEVNIIRMDFGN